MAKRSFLLALVLALATLEIAAVGGPGSSGGVDVRAPVIHAVARTAAAGASSRAAVGRAAWLTAVLAIGAAALFVAMAAPAAGVRRRWWGRPGRPRGPPGEQFT